jgi:LysM repeat protein
MVGAVSSTDRISSYSANNNGGRGEYRIQRGDILSEIAARFGTDVETLARMNGIANPNRIFAGQSINVPSGGRSHVVERGDTLSGIAANTNSSVGALMSANPEIRNANQIYPGQTIRIPAGQPQIQTPQTPNVPVAGGSVQPRVSPTPVANRDVLTRLGDALATGEGNYESYNTGTQGVAGGRVGHSYLNPPPGTVTGRTINEILATQGKSGYETDRMFATGKYQTTIDTLRAAKQAMGLTGNELYTPEMQERVFREFLVEKAGGGRLASFINSGEGTIDTAQYAAAKEWASIAVPRGLTLRDGRISDGTLSYYDKPGTNSASMTATRALRDVLSNIDRTASTPTETAPVADRSQVANGTIDGNAEARRNGIAIKSNAVRLTNLDANMTPVFAAVAQAARELGLPNPVITSGNDSTHMNGSLHYQNRALDFRGNNITLAQGQRLEDRVKELLGANFDVDFEIFPSRPSNNHLHVEFDPN